MKLTKEFSILLKAFMPAILSLLLVIGLAVYFQHQTNVGRRKCIDSGGIIILGYGGDTCIPKRVL